jgi:ABC-2 type transport system ATP-binding protein
MDAVLTARALMKRFGDVQAVNGVDVSVAPGERVGFLGPNGAGKTTTLLMLLGAVTPDAGTIEICGHRLPRGRSKAMERVGFAAGYLPLPERLRVREFLHLFGQLYGLHDPTPQIDAGLERFGVTHLGDAMGNELSSGQRTLVGIVKAALHGPALLILDEPTASLDPDTADWVRARLAQYCAERRATMLIASHNMTEVERLCERVIIMKCGRIEDDDTPRGLLARYGRTTLEEVFLDVARGRGPERAEREAAQ